MRLRDIASAARVELIEPLPQRPSRRYLLQLATTNTQNYFNELSNSGRPWSVAETQIFTSPNVTEYVLSVPDVGKIMDVTTCDTSNDAHIERQIPFWDLGDLRTDWNAPANIPVITFYDSQHSAQRIAFSRKNWQDATYATIYPIPQFACAYRVLYGVKGMAPDMSLDDSPILTQHHPLLVTKTALDALPGSQWWANESENRIRRKELAVSLSARIPSMEQQFRRYIRNMTVNRQTSRLTYSID